MDALLQKQRDFFHTGATLPVSARVTYLKKLQAAIRQQQDELCRVLYLDLGKSPTEAYMCEIGMCLEEIAYFVKHLPKLARDKTVKTAMSNFPAKSIIRPEPQGNVLIISPWNYPFLLSVEPLIDAVAAGNTVVLKPSAYSPHTSQAVRQLLQTVFPEEYVAVVTGGRQENQHLLSQPFDYIFFTGSTAVGKEVLRRAAENLTPVTLELGGKSPCLVDESARLDLAARRIVFGKFLNCGQTCVAPDYIWCHESIREPLLNALQREITAQFGSRPLQNPHYGKIINEKHFRRLTHLLNPDKIVFGGETNPQTLQIAPTLLSPATWDDPVMQEEIFGPILPVLTYRSLDEVIDTLHRRPHPLALYLFSEDRTHIRRITRHCQYGGGCINDTIMHLTTPYLPFGGVGASGMGHYHGKFGFETFSHHKSLLDRKTWLDMPARYQPYTSWKDKLLRLFLR